MTTARKKQISLVDTKFYHCSSTTNRANFLSGKDIYSGKNLDYRKKWVEDKLVALSEVFCIDICAYVVMDTSLNIVFHVDDDKAKKLTKKEVLIRWHKEFNGTELTQRYVANDRLNKKEMQQLEEVVVLFRERLYSICWFMKQLKEDISRRANEDEGVKGPFWYRRFKIQALLDEASIISCMAYIDLNPIKAKLIKNLNKSHHSSIQKRIEAADKGKQPEGLMKFIASPKGKTKGVVFEFNRYLELIELTSLYMRNNKKAALNKTKPILEQLNIAPENWITLTSEFDQIFRSAVGRESAINSFCETMQLKRRISISQSKKLFGA